MSNIPVTQQQLDSHLFLQGLVQQQKLTDFCLTENSISKVADQQENQANRTKLVVFSEGIQLVQLQLLSERLASDVRIHYFSVVTVAGVAGFAIAANVEVLDSAGIKQALLDVAEQLSLELCLVDKVPSLREPGLLLMDMDSTVITVECIDEIALLAGVGEEVAAVTAEAMQGQLDFAQSLRTRVACLADADEGIIQQVRNALPLMQGVASLVSVLKAHNWKVAIASGGFTYFADYLAKRLELDAAVANQLEIKQGKLTGHVLGGIIDAQVKADTLLALAEKWSIPQSQTIAMGDGANDLVMMNAAALGVACHAKPIVKQKADIAISKGGLNALLWVLSA